MRCASIEHSRSRRGRRPRRRDTEPDLEGPLGAAERVAADKARWVRQLVHYVLIVGLLYLFIRPVGVIVGLVWGLGLAGDFVKKVLEPGLRRRWVTKEVQRQLDGRVSEERREIQGRHQRSLEALSASIAHEIRNPITAAKSLVQQMGEDPHANENVRYANVALDELDRVEKSISHLLRYAREEEMAMTSLRMADVVDSALAVHRDRTARLGVEVRREIDSVGAMRGDPEKLRRVLVNLLGNALDALEEARTERPRLEVALGENLAGTEVWVRVRDNGPGIDARVLEKIFDPFYTSKPTGTGLGLALSKKVVDAHGGALEAHSTPGAGTEFVLSFPKRSEARS